VKTGEAVYGTPRTAKEAFLNQPNAGVSVALKVPN
jgi:hypothetical protein